MARLQKAQRIIAKFGRRCVVIPETAFDGPDLDAAAHVLEVTLRSTDLPSDAICPTYHRHDPVGCLAHLLATGIAC
jgi:hypothetical protein